MHHITAARLLLSLGADASLLTQAGEDAKTLALKCGVPEKDLPEYFGLNILVINFQDF
jgi:hypothetical protein